MNMFNRSPLAPPMSILIIIIAYAVVLKINTMAQVTVCDKVQSFPVNCYLPFVKLKIMQRNTLAHKLPHWCINPGQDGIFSGKVGRIFQGSIEISQELLMRNHGLCHFF